MKLKGFEQYGHITPVLEAYPDDKLAVLVEAAVEEYPTITSEQLWFIVAIRAGVIDGDVVVEE